MLETSEIRNYAARTEFLRSTVTSIPDYPQPGILFRDITSLCENREAFADTVELLSELYAREGIAKIVAAEARGFVFGAPLAARLKAGFVMVRKPGKLPRRTLEESYVLEYGTSRLQIHEDSIKRGERVLVVDDLLATGGTVDALLSLVSRLGGEIAGAAFVIELFDLGGADLIERKWGVRPFSLIKFPGH